MAFKDLNQTEIDQLLSRERVMRIGLEADGELFLVPLGYTWHRNALYAMTTHGRKTLMAAVNPKVSFQVDTSATTGQYSWHSVSGEGTFEVVTDRDEIETVSPLLVSQFSGYARVDAIGICREAGARRSRHRPRPSVPDDREKKRACLMTSITKRRPTNRSRETSVTQAAPGR